MWVILSEDAVLRDEKADQQDHAAEAKAMDNETAADYMLMGSVKSIVQKDGKKICPCIFCKCSTCRY